MLFIFRNLVSSVVTVLREAPGGVSKGPAKLFRRKVLLAGALLAALLIAVVSIALANSTAQAPTFKQDWTNTGLITANNDWGSVPGIIGYNGTGLALSAGIDPQTILLDGSLTPVTVLANQTNPDNQNTGGVAEFQLTNPTIAIQGDNTANAPHIVINLDTTNRSNINVRYNLRDVDGSNNNAAQQVALQYRVGNLVTYTNIPAGYVADATTGPNQATLVTPVNVTLPAAADNQSLVQLRIITTKATTNQKDEWVGIDDISVTSTPTASSQSVTANAAKTITLSGSDADGDNLTFAIASGPTNGTLGSVGTPTCTGTAPKTCQANVTYTPNAGFNGSDSFNFRVNDGTVNSADATASITVDTVAPSAPAITNPANNSYDTDGAFTVSGTAEANSTVELFEGAQSKGTTTANGSGSWSINLSGVSEGDHTYTAKVTDAVGNTSSSSTAVTVKVDTTAPGAPTAGLDPASDTGSSNTDSITKNNTPNFNGTAEANSTVKLYDGGSTLLGTTTADNLGNWSFTVPGGSALSDGTHSITAKATDAAGNTSAASTALSVNVDTVAPQTVISSGPLGLLNSTTSIFVFLSDEPGSTFECKLDSGSFESCNSPKTYNGLSQGSHTFQAQSTDTAGNTDQSPDSRAFTVDTAAPTTTITSGPSGQTNDSTPTFEFTSDQTGSSFECRLTKTGDTPGSFASCSSGNSFGPLTSDGEYTFEVRATDDAGNTGSAASRTFTVDTTAPTTTIDDGPAEGSTVNNAKQSFEFSSSETGSTFECSINNGVYQACSSGDKFTFPEGSNTFQVRATDAADNTGSAASRSFTVDASAPNTTINSGPSGTTNSTTATFAFSSSEANSTFECKLDSGSFASCISPKTYSNLSEGSHTFQVRATDVAGHTDSTPDSRTFTVDAVAPSAPEITSPANNSYDNNGAFSVSGTAEANSTIKLYDGSSTTPVGTTTANNSGTWSIELTGVAEGSHTYTAKATDGVGNTSPASNARTVIVDTTAPNTTITGGPNGPTTDATPTFSFSGSDNTSSGANLLFSYKVDGGGWSTYSSETSVTLGNLSEGNHTFYVKAKDEAGNEDQSPAERSFTVGSPLSLGASPATLAFGQSTTLSGKLTDSNGAALANKRVILEQRPSGATSFIAVPKGSVLTDSSGNFHLAGVKPAKNTDYQARFAGDGTNPAITSELKKVEVKVSVSLKVKTTDLKLGKSRTISGAVTPKHTGPVTISIERDGQPLETKTVNTKKSKYRFSYKPTGVGTYTIGQLRTHCRPHGLPRQRERHQELQGRPIGSRSSRRGL